LRCADGRIATLHRPTHIVPPRAPTSYRARVPGASHGLAWDTPGVGHARIRR
jgi:hypothetical protein